MLSFLTRNNDLDNYYYDQFITHQILIYLLG